MQRSSASVTMHFRSDRNQSKRSDRVMTPFIHKFNCDSDDCTRSSLNVWWPFKVYRDICFYYIFIDVNVELATGNGPLPFLDMLFKMEIKRYLIFR